MLIAIGMPVLLVMFFVNLYFCFTFADIAREKGYNESGKYFCLCFFFGIIGFLLVAALPERRNIEVRHSVDAPLTPSSASRESSAVTTNTNAPAFEQSRLSKPPAFGQSQLSKPPAFGKAQPPKPSEWFCVKCGASNSSNYAQCKKCGAYRS